MTPEEYFEHIKRSKTDDYLKAVSLYPDVIDKLEKTLISTSRWQQDENHVFIRLGSTSLMTDDHAVQCYLIPEIKNYFESQGWLVAIQSGYLNYCLHLYKPSKKHRLYVWFRNVFNSKLPPD